MDGANNIKSSPDLRKYFFDLGWEYFSAKQGAPDDASEYPDFIGGYNSAKERLRPVRADRFHLKWLQIRYNALKRNRIFDDSVTAKFIREIDVDYCPVTQIKLTHSAGLDSDWSVDRVQNNLGYVIGNLVVVSSLANKAKGAMTYDEIVEASRPESNVNGLTPIEWTRWRFICSLNITEIENDDGVGYRVAPCVIPMPNSLFVNASYILQYAIAKRAIGYEAVNIFPAVIQGLPKKTRQALNDLVRDAAKLKYTVQNYEGEIWLSHKLFYKFGNIFLKMRLGEREHVKNLFNKVRTCGAVDVGTEAWDPNKRGYN